MLLYASRAPPKAPKRRSRAGMSPGSRSTSPCICPPIRNTWLTNQCCSWTKGCIRCKEKKKKCNEQRPQCDRCIERSLDCEYEAVKPRKRRKTSALRQELEAKYFTSNELYDTPDEYNDFETNYISDQQEWIEPAEFVYGEQEACANFPKFDLQTSNDVGNDVEEIVRSEPFFQTGGTLVRSRSQFPDLAMIAPSPTASPLLEFNAPAFAEFSPNPNRRRLVDHFCNVLSHLIVFKEDTGNPFRQLVLPLSASSSPVLNAIFALSSAHLEYGGVICSEKSLDFHSKALQGLAKLIDQNETAKRDEILGAIMLLVYYEVLVQRGTANIVNSHLRGAMTIIKTQPENPNPTSLFLERAFRFYDVIAALSLGTAPISPTTISNPPYPQIPESDCSPLSNVDTLLGASTTLWPIIHRLSDLLTAQADLRQAEESGNTSKASVLRAEFESTASAIELALTNWTPQIPVSQPHSHDSMFSDFLMKGVDLDHGIITAEDDTISPSPSSTSESSSRLQSIISNAEAYRQASLIYLYRYIRLLPTTSSLVQKHTKLALLACSRVVEYKGPMSALLWPLFISSCEAIDEVDREMAGEAFGGVGKRQGMTNIGRAWDVVREVWRRGDACVESDGKERIPARQICVEMGFSIVFG